ncbi:peptide ABC transporter ATP-binding protein [Labrys sp. WJW]|uniref:ABC transporter ATP-binding protein n=1 Tax=Labrys sp. WJW TaxID=1737983 RepID=UPI00082A25E4|nr:dipeptide/oligopeptide/nickel ABC transporter ATP-binding protein [Labrys sp. WJW]OCC00917.1 peptide ABC transporter ATP-binding protein [Labrys sp. WJW]
MADALLEIEALCSSVRGPAGRHAILDGIDLAIAPGEIVGLAGGSGAGKTSLARAILRLHPVDAGSIRFEGREITHLAGKALRRIRPRLQMVFQDPLAAFNPRARVERVIGDPLRIWHSLSRAQERQRILALMERVGLPERLLGRFPHELSGGQRQRVAIARALATDPALIILDEPVSALDVAVRAQILNLLLDIREKAGTALLFIAHDLAVMAALCDRLCVMDAGRIVESGPPGRLVAVPQSEMTRLLVAAAPKMRF